MSTVESQSGSLPFQISANTAILWYQYWFWRGCIAFLVTPDHHFAQAVLYHMTLMSGTFRISTHILVDTVSSHARIQTASSACSTAGSTNKEWSPTYGSTAAVVWLRICAKGLIQVTATSFILVSYIWWAFKTPISKIFRTPILKLLYRHLSLLFALSPLFLLSFPFLSMIYHFNILSCLTSSYSLLFTCHWCYIHVSVLRNIARTHLRKAIGAIDQPVPRLYQPRASHSSIMTHKYQSNTHSIWLVIQC